MTDADEIEKLKAAILRLHGAHAEHVESVPVRETFQGLVVWDGVVEVFDLTDHPTARQAYAWSHEADSGGRRYVAVLREGKVDTPLIAVRVAIVAEHRERKG